VDGHGFLVQRALLMMVLASLSGFLFLALWAINLGVVVPLSLSCLVLIVVIPSAAWRGRLSVPVYALMMFASAFVAFGVGRVAGWPSVHGTTLGVVVSFIFFLLVATAAGCFFGIFFYRHPSDDSMPISHDQSV
jgi:hypothetical protein